MPKNLWDKTRSITYIKIGSFFLVGFFLLFLTLISIREVNVFKGTYLINIKFDFAEGLRSSSPVRFCGVDVGEVKTVRIAEEGSKPLVYIQAKIEKGIKIPKNSYFFINSLSLFGEKYLEVDPPEKAEAYLIEGETVDGLSPVPLFSIFAALSKTMNDVGKIVGDTGTQDTVGNILDNLNSITLNLDGILKDMRNKQGTIGRLLYDDSLYQTTEEFMQDLKTHPWKLLYKPKEPRKKK